MKEWHLDVTGTSEQVEKPLTNGNVAVHFRGTIREVQRREIYHSTTPSEVYSWEESSSSDSWLEMQIWGPTEFASQRARAGNPCFLRMLKFEQLHATVFFPCTIFCQSWKCFKF